MIEFTTGNIFESGADILVNTVNCKGVMGKGIAKQFKERYRDMYLDYRQECKEGLWTPGMVRLWNPFDIGYRPGITQSTQIICNFATKDDWKSPSRYEWIAQGLETLRHQLLLRPHSSVALPALGSDNGRLHWGTVRRMIVEALGNLPNRIIVYDKNKLLVIGDVHGDWKTLEHLYKKYEPEVVLQCGDFGIWPTTTVEDIIDISVFPRNSNEIREGGWDGEYVETFFCRGNHEWHDKLDELPQDIPRALNGLPEFPNCFFTSHVPTGHITQIKGHNILFLGGAKSVDQHFRKRGETWWPQEVMTPEQFKEMYEKLKTNIAANPPDIVISHTCPRSVFNQMMAEPESPNHPAWKRNKIKSDDPTMDQWDKVVELLLDAPPKYWFFGHFHTYEKIDNHPSGITFYALPEIEHIMKIESVDNEIEILCNK